MTPKDNPPTIGIVGSGTMGSGIALTALYRFLPVVIQDVAPDMLERARDYLGKYLARKGLQSYLNSVTLTTDLNGLSGVDILIEAAPEDLVLKQDLFARLDLICPPPAILATNTSTLSVSAIAAGTRSPERVAGMHFFNPAPVLPLVEVVRGADTSPGTVAALVALAEKLGKTPVVAADTPGFIVNRVARPFYGEALRLLSEGVAPHEAIDRLVREGGGFRMGPFELMDLIGVDINFTATQSMFDQTFGEPRYRPHWIQARLVAQNRLGRKTGRGFYTYGELDRETRASSPPEALQPGSPLWISSGGWAPGLAERCRSAGYTLKQSWEGGAPPAAGLVVAGRSEGLAEIMAASDRALPVEVPLICQAADITVSEMAPWVQRKERLVGFDGLFAATGQAVTLVPSPNLADATRTQTERFFRSLGLEPVWITDSAGLVLPRTVCMLANEAAFATMEQVADSDTIDQAMRLGVNYPRGPVEWAHQLGFSRVVGVLDHLQAEYGEERYRAAPVLRRWAREEMTT